MVCLGHCKKITQARCLKNNLFLAVLEAGSPKPRYKQIWCLVKVHFWVHRQLSFLSSFPRVLKPFIRVPFS